MRFVHVFHVCFVDMSVICFVFVSGIYFVDLWCIRVYFVRVSLICFVDISGTYFVDVSLIYFVNMADKCCVGVSVSSLCFVCSYCLVLSVTCSLYICGIYVDLLFLSVQQFHFIFILNFNCHPLIFYPFKAKVVNMAN
jgi:hypothetical protein